MPEVTLSLDDYLTASAACARVALDNMARVVELPHDADERGALIQEGERFALVGHRLIAHVEAGE